jgi:hypothetical protein
VTKARIKSLKPPNRALIEKLTRWLAGRVAVALLPYRSAKVDMGAVTEIGVVRLRGKA